MKKLLNIVALATTVFAVSCQKNDTATDTTSSTLTTQELAAVSGISLNARVTDNTIVTARGHNDSIYAVNCYERKQRIEKVDFTALSTAITNYLTTNYNGYASIKAAKILDSSNNVVAYIVVINYNNKPIAIKFDAQGSFIKILEQRQGFDIKHGQHFHNGGWCDDRDGKHRDTIALSALPISITSYIATNFSSDVLLKAFKGRDGNVIVITKDSTGQIYINVFSSTGSFIERKIAAHIRGSIAQIDQSSLLTSITTYLSTTYPAYTFKHAFSISNNGIVKRYVVIIDANTSKYAVEFDANGNFLEAHILR